MKRVVAILLLGACSFVAAAQTPAGEAGNTATSLSGGFFRGDFFNASAFVNGVYDSVEQNLGSASNLSGFGYSLGGSVSASKAFSNSLLSLSYRGEYRNYPSGFGGTGTNQNLNLIYTKRLGRRWEVSFNEGAGIMLYNSIAYNIDPAAPPLANPFSPSTRFLQSSVTATYQQSARLSYTLSGNFFLNRYSYGGATGSTGGIFSGSATYVLSLRTSVSATYSHDEFRYQFGGGASSINGVSGTVSHTFGRLWLVKVSAGGSHISTAGLYRIPVLINDNGVLIPAFAQIPYSVDKTIPTFQGSVTHPLGRFNLTVSASHGVSPGNGTYLTSSNTAVNGYVTRNFNREAVLTFSGGFNSLKSVAAAQGLNQAFKQSTATVFYSRVLMPHISGEVSYSLIDYSNLSSYSGRLDNRFTFGVSFSLKNVPTTLF